MDEKRLRNIWTALSNDGVTDSDFDTWKSNFADSEKIQSNVHGYLTEKEYTSSDYDTWSSNIGIKKKDITESPSGDGGSEQSSSEENKRTPEEQAEWEKTIPVVDWDKLSLEQPKVVGKDTRGDDYRDPVKSVGLYPDESVLSTAFEQKAADVKATDEAKAKKDEEWTEHIKNSAKERVGVRENLDGTHSTHLMRTEMLPNGDWVSFPTLFQNEDNSWTEMSTKDGWEEAYEESVKRGEDKNFGKDKERALAYGEGSWKEKDRYEGTILGRKPGENFDELLSTITPNLIEQRDEFVVPKMNYNFGQYGFKFKEEGLDDAMVVTSANGKTIDIELDPILGIMSKSNAKNLKTFLRQNKEESSKAYAASDGVKKDIKIKNEGEVKAATKELNLEVEEWLSKGIDIEARAKQLKTEADYIFAGKTMEDINADPVLLEKYNRILKESADLDIFHSDRFKQQELLKVKGARLDKLAGQYYAMQGEQGVWAGGLWNSLVKGGSEIVAAGVGYGTDIAASIAANRGLGEEAYKMELIRIAREDGLVGEDVKLEGLSKDELIEALGGDTTGYIDRITMIRGVRGETAFDKADAKIVDKASKGVKYFDSYKSAVKGKLRNPFSNVAKYADAEEGIVDVIKSNTVKILGDKNTTEQWAALQQKSFWGGAALGATQSIPALIGGWQARVVNMFMQVSSGLDTEMENNPEFDDISESERMLVKGPVGFAVAALESIGLRNIMNQKGVLNHFVAKAIGTSTSKTTAKTFAQFIRQDVKSMMGRGLLTLGAGGLAEFETGAAQEIAEVSIKEIYNMSKGKEMFKTPDSFVEFVTDVGYAGIQEMAGSFFLSTPSAVSNAVMSNSIETISDEEFELFQKAAKDPTYKSMFMASLKQKIATKQITKAEAKIELATLNKVLGLDSKVPDEYNTEQKKKSLALLYRKQELEAKIEGKDKSLVKRDIAKINEINEQLVNIAANPEVTVDGQQIIEEGIPEMGKESEVQIKEGIPEMGQESEVQIEDGVTQEDRQDIDSFFGDEVDENTEKVTPNISINSKGKESSPSENNEQRNKVVRIAKKAATSIAKILPKTRVILHETNEEYMKYSKGNESSRGEYNFNENTIHVNLSKANNRTVPHEIFHAVLVQKVQDDPRIAKVADKMMESVKESLPESHPMRKAIDAHAEKYTGDLADTQQEERLAELVGILADSEVGYNSLPQVAKNKVVEFFKKIANKFGLKLGEDFGKSDDSVIELINTIARKTASGEVLLESDVSVIDNIDKEVNEEQGSDGEVGTIVKPREQKSVEAPNPRDDHRSWVRDIVEVVDINELVGENFVTNMYDYTSAGLIDLGNDFSIELLGGRNYVPIIMDKTGKSLGDISNLAAFNTKAQAEGFIRNSVNGNASLFAPHSGTLNGSWQFQQHIFEALTDLVLDKGILSNRKLISTFNDGLGSKGGKDALRTFNKNNGSKIRTLNSFQSNPKKLVSLLNIENNYSPNLRKILNDKIASNKDFQKAIGVKNLEQFYNKIKDPLNDGVVGGELMTFIKFDPKTFSIAKTSPSDIDHHPSFGWTVRAKIENVFQPSRFYNSHEVTDTYTRYNKDETKISRKSDEKYKQSNVSSSAGAIPKVAKVTTRQQKVVRTQKGEYFANQYMEAKAKGQTKKMSYYKQRLYTMGEWSRIAELNKKDSPATRQQKVGRTERLAPNGKQSNLNDVQYDVVRTPAFKNWFGNWETDPENASKVVDENGEPMVTYHGSAADFNVFDKKKLGSLTNTEIAKAGFFFASNKAAADQYAFIGGLQNPYLENKLTESRAFFLNIKNPYKGTNQEWNNLLNWASDGSKKYDSPTALKKANKEFKEFLLKENFDGVDFDNGLEIVAFEPTQAKLADGTNTTFDPDAPSIRQQKEGSSYFSNALKSISNIKEINPKNPKQWIKALTDVNKNGGIKSVGQELEWIGLEEYLNEWVKDNKKKSIPMDVVEQYINDNRIEIQDVTKGGRSLMDEVNEDRFQEKRPKYSGYQLEGGENYQEVLLTMPEKKKIPERPISEENGKFFIGNLISPFNTRKEAEDYRDRNLNVAMYSPKENYKSSHWDESNVLAHIRLNERTLPNGEKVLFLEEVQSDWAQDGKKKGFQRELNDKEESEIKILEQEKNDILDGIKSYQYLKDLNKGEFDLEVFSAVEQQATNTISNRYSDENSQRESFLKGISKVLAYWGKSDRYKTPELTQSQKEEFYNLYLQDISKSGKKLVELGGYGTSYRLSETNEINKLDEKIESIKYEVRRGNIPNMPYKKTDQWVGLAIRRAMKMAADKGIDRIAWVTGEQSADRYSLEKQVDEIRYRKFKNNKYVIVINKDGREQGQRVLKESEIEGFLGKEIAQKIINNEGEAKKATGTLPEVKSLSGLDLKFGGEGMKTFYNSILPKVAKEEAKRFDDSVEIEVVDFEGMKWKPPSKQLSIAITPKMKAELEGPTPLFRQQKEGGKSIHEYIVEARNDGFNDSIIKDKLLRMGGFDNKEITKAMSINYKLLQILPKSFAEIAGGLKKGSVLFGRVDRYRKSLITKNKKNETLTEQDIIDKTVAYLESQPEYKAEEETTQMGMTIEMQKDASLRPTERIGQKIRNARILLSQRKEGARDIPKIKSELRNFLRKALPISLYTKPEVMKLLKGIGEATQKNIDEIYNDVVEFAVSKNVEILERSIGKILGNKYTKKESGRLKGKSISVDILERIDAIKKMVAGKNATATDIVELNEKLKEKFDEMSNILNPTDAEMNQIIDIQIAMEYNNSKQMGANDINKIDSLDRVNESLDSIINEGKEEFKEAIKKQRAKDRSEFERMFKDITGKVIDLTSDKALAEKQELIDENEKVREDNKSLAKEDKKKVLTTEQIDARFREMQYVKASQVMATEADMAKSNNKIIRWAQSFFKGASYKINAMEALDGLMTKISHSSGGLYDGASLELVADRMDESSIKYKSGKMYVERLLRGKIKEMYGKNWAKKERANRLNSYVLTRTNGTELHLSQNDMYYLYNQFKDPALHPTFKGDKMFGSNYVEIMKDLEANLDPKVKAFADWQVNELFPELYNKYNEAYRNVYKTNMPLNKNYAGFLYREGESYTALDLLSNSGSANSSISSASTKSRVSSTAPIIAMDGTDALIKYLDDMEYFAAYAENVNSVNKIFENKYIKSAIKNTVGNKINELIERNIQTIANRNSNDSSYNKMISDFNSAFVISRIAINPLITIKQYTSMFTYSADIGPLNWLKYGAKNKAQQVAVWKEVKANSVYLEHRKYDSVLNTIESFTDKDEPKVLSNSTLNFATRMLMINVRLGDVGAIMLGGLPNYSYYKAEFQKKNPNATEQEAIDHAVKKFERDTKRTQQSSDLQDKDMTQKSDPLSRAANMFLTTPKQYLRKEIQAIRELSRKLKAWDTAVGKGTVGQNLYKLTMFHVVMPVLFQYVSAGLPGILADWDEEEDARDLWRAAILGNINAIFVFGQIIEMFADFATEKPWAGEGSKTVGLFQIGSSIVKKLKYIERTKDPAKVDAKKKDLYLELATLFMVPAPTVAKMVDNYSKLGEGSLEKNILRVLNYSNYVIDGSKKSKSKTESANKQKKGTGRSKRSTGRSRRSTGRSRRVRK